MLASFTLDTFKPLLDSSFAISGGPEGVLDEPGEPLLLVEASALGAGGDETRDPFSLLFLRRSDVVLLDETYTLTHPALGSFELFIVPVAQDADGVRYEAIFN
jgi:hypothetical protein